MKQIDDVKHKHKKEKHEKKERKNEIDQYYKNKMSPIIKKYAELKMSFSSAKRRINDLSSVISDYSFILNYIDNDIHNQIEIESHNSTTREDISTMKKILEKKEKRYNTKLNNLKEEEKILNQKRHELSAKKTQIQKRYESISISMKENNIDTKFLENFSDQFENQIKYTDLLHKNDDSKEFIDSCENLSFNDTDCDQQEDLIIQQLQVQEQQLNELVMKNKIQKEKIESKSSEIRLLKKSYSSNPINLKQEQNIPIQKPYLENQNESDQYNYSEESFTSEQYEQLVLKQKKIDEENKSIDLLIVKNNQIKNEIEADYEIKLQKITKLSDQSTEPDKLIIAIHKMNDEIIESKEKLSQLDLSKKRLLRQNANIKNSIEKIKNDQDELNKRRIQVNNKKKIINEQEINLKERHTQYEETLQYVDNQTNVLNNKKAEVEQLEYQISCLEEKVEETNEEIKRLSGVVDKLLLSASSNRADSRMSRLQEMIDSKSDFDMNIENHSENTFSNFLKNSTNGISSP